MPRGRRGGRRINKMVDDIRKDDKEKEINLSFFKKIWASPVAATWCLTIIIVIGFLFFLFAFLNFDKQGLACQHQPFKWGSEKILESKVSGLHCDCFAKDGRNFKIGFGGYDPYSSVGSVNSRNLSWIED